MKTARPALIIAFGAALDLAAKLWARTSLEPYGAATDFLPFVALRLTFNQGVSFSLFSFEGETARLVLLLATAGYHLADTVQTLCVFVLRCYRITVLPLILYCTVLWGVGLGGSYLLAYRGLGPWPAMQSPLAFWVMSALALVATALVLAVLLWRTLTRTR